MPTRVKICGITRPEDAALAAELGADFLGFNLVAGPRKIDACAASNMLIHLAKSRKFHADLRLVALCAAPSTYEKATEWTEFATSTHFRPLQIYAKDYALLKGGQTFIKEWWMVRHVDSRESILEVAAECSVLDHLPSGILLDTASKSSELGGTGKSFNWHWIAEARDAGELEGLPPIILAGGLTPDNVAEAIRIAKPYAVDVSSGVEISGKPGVKDPVKMRDFIQAAKNAF